MNRIHYRPQRSCEGYVFTGVCLSTGGGSASVHAGIPPPRDHAPPGPDPPGTRPPRTRPPRDQTPPRERCYCCGRYASYWNAFLFELCLGMGGGVINSQASQCMPIQHCCCRSVWVDPYSLTQVQKTF